MATVTIKISDEGNKLSVAMDPPTVNENGSPAEQLGMAVYTELAVIIKANETYKEVEEQDERENPL